MFSSVLWLAEAPGGTGELFAMQEWKCLLCLKEAACC